jgi:anti-sigma-K factor RskA
MSRVDEPPDDLDEFGSVIELLRRGPDLDPVEQPPASVWAGIAAELGLDTPKADPVVVLDRERGRRRAVPGPWVALAAAAAVVALAIPVVIVAGRGGEPDAEVVAAVELDTLAGAGSGVAEVVERDGRRELAVSVEGLETIEDGHYEVWLLTPEVDDMVSLGVLENGATFELPEGLDLERFSVVDISAEPDDGDPTHSGDSRLRGQLTV